MKRLLFGLAFCIAAYSQVIISGGGGAGGGGGGSVSITATAPIVVTPSPTTGTGVISCPTCSTGSLVNKVNSVNLDGSGAFTCNFSLGYICLVNQNGDATNTLHPTFSNLPTNAFVYLAMNMTNLKAIDFTDIPGDTPRCNIQNSFVACGNNTNGYTSSGGIFTTTWWSNGTNLYANGDTGNFQTVNSAYVYTNQLSLQDSQNITNPPSGISMLFGAPLKFVPKCTSAASPAACSNYAAGAVALPTGGTTLVVNTSAVSEPGSMILLTPDSSLGSTLSVTCNTGIPSGFQASNRVNSTSFTISVGIAPVTNPFCFNYFVITN